MCGRGQAYVNCPQDSFISVGSEEREADEVATMQRKKLGRDPRQLEKGRGGSADTASRAIVAQGERMPSPGMAAGGVARGKTSASEK